MFRFLPQTKQARVQWLLNLLIAAALVVFAFLVVAVFDYLGGQEQPALAQSGGFDSGSNGSDGALILTTPGTIIFDPASFNPPLDPDGDYVYHFTNIVIGAGVTVTLKGPPYLDGPLYWLASGTVQIDGVIDLNGQKGQNGTGIIPGARFPAAPGAGGFSGGTLGVSSNSPARPGTGPGGGGSYLQSGGGGGHAVAGVGGYGGGGGGGPAYGNNFLVPLIGGSGGGGGGSTGGGGGGGGALLIASSMSITVVGKITANGGVGGGGTGLNGGGGGSGGAIHLLAPFINGNGQLLAKGGNEHTNGWGGGSYGRIRLEAFQHAFTGVTDPGAILTAPFMVYLPENPPPSVRVVDVAGVIVPESPTASFETPDVTINVPSAITLTINARYVPLGAIVQLYVISEDGMDQLVNSTPLTGTFELSTATITTILPTGFSRMYVRSDWTP
jgi:hypothetical protein